MLSINYSRILSFFALLVFFAMGAILAQASSNPYYIGPSGNIEGTVSDEAGKPVANANVYYTAGEDNIGLGFYYTTADAQGKFTITNVIAGKGTLTVNATWYEEQKTALEVSADSTTKETISLKPLQTGSISGSIINASTGEPVPGIAVSVFPNYYFAGMMMGKGASTSGMENLDVVKKGNGINVKKVNPAKAKKNKVANDKKRKGSGNSATKEFANLFFPNYYMGDITTQAVTDADGKFSFPKLPAGPYSVNIEPEAKSDFQRPESLYVELAEGGSETADFKLVPFSKGSVSGTVANHKGEPVFGAIIDVYNDKFYGYTVSGKDGKFSMISVPAGDYQVTAINQYFWLSSALYKITVEEGKDSVLEVTFKENSSESGDATVVGKSGSTGSNQGGDSFMGMTGSMMQEKNIRK